MHKDETRLTRSCVLEEVAVVPHSYLDPIMLYHLRCLSISLSTHSFLKIPDIAREPHLPSCWELPLSCRQSSWSLPIRQPASYGSPKISLDSTVLCAAWIAMVTWDRKPGHHGRPCGERWSDWWFFHARNFLQIAYAQPGRQVRHAFALRDTTTIRPLASPEASAKPDDIRSSAYVAIELSLFRFNGHHASHPPSAWRLRVGHCQRWHN